MRSINSSGRVTFTSILIISGLFFYSFSTSCPHGVGVSEFGVAVCLSLAVLWVFGKSMVLNARNPFRINAVLEGLVCVSMLVLFCLPFFIAYISKVDLTIWELSRDVLPYFYLILPVILISLDLKDVSSLSLLLPYAISFVGLVYSFRFVLYINQNYGSVISFLISQSTMFSSALTGGGVGRDAELSNDILCLPFDASVLFGGIFSSLLGIIFISSNLKSLGKSILWLAFSIIPILALVLISSRASLALLALSLFLILVIKVRNSFSFQMVFVGIASIAAFVLWPYLSIALEILLAKQAAVGSNNKLEEFQEIYDLITCDSVSAMFGKGWGASFFNPAVGQDASFSHSLVSYILLKGGFIGLAIIIVYIAWITYMALIVGLSHLDRRIIKLDKTRIIIPALLAFFSVLLVSLFFQPLYKTPTYGMILLYVLIAYRMCSLKSIR